MKILDRYILREFLLPFVYCSFAFILLYLVADLFEHMDEFLKAHIPWYTILQYYLFLLPSIFLQTGPFSIVLSLIYELGHFARHLEIVGMKASGVTPKRIVRPFLILGLALTGVYFLINELVLPKINTRLEDFKKMAFNRKEKDDSKIYENLTYSNAKGNYIFYIRELNLSKKMAKGVQIHYFKGPLEKLIRADQGRWLDNAWWLFNGTVARYNQSGEIEEEIEKFFRRKVDVTESPQELIQEDKAGNHLNFIHYKVSLEKRFGSKIPSAQFVYLYSKLADPWICFILILMIAPLGVQIPKGGVFAVLGKTILLTLAYYGAQFFISAMGKQGNLQPVLACWLSNIGFGGLGLILWGKLK